jgi:hypothetical protein
MLPSRSARRPSNMIMTHSCFDERTIMCFKTPIFTDDFFCNSSVYPSGQSALANKRLIAPNRDVALQLHYIITICFHFVFLDSFCFFMTVRFGYLLYSRTINQMTIDL